MTDEQHVALLHELLAHGVRPGARVVLRQDVEAAADVDADEFGRFLEHRGATTFIPAEGHGYWLIPDAALVGAA